MSFTVEQWCSSRGILLSRGHLTMFQDIFVCHDCGKGEALLACSGSKLRMLLQTPWKHKVASCNKKASDPKCSSVQVSILCGRVLRGKVQNKT